MIFKFLNWFLAILSSFSMKPLLLLHTYQNPLMEHGIYIYCSNFLFMVSIHLSVPVYSFLFGHPVTAVTVLQNLLIVRFHRVLFCHPLSFYYSPTTSVELSLMLVTLPYIYQYLLPCDPFYRNSSNNSRRDATQPLTYDLPLISEWDRASLVIFHALKKLNSFILSARYNLSDTYPRCFHNTQLIPSLVMNILGLTKSY